MIGKTMEKVQKVVNDLDKQIQKKHSKQIEQIQQKKYKYLIECNKKLEHEQQLNQKKIENKNTNNNTNNANIKDSSSSNNNNINNLNQNNEICLKIADSLNFNLTSLLANPKNSLYSCINQNFQQYHKLKQYNQIYDELKQEHLLKQDKKQPDLKQIQQTYDNNIDNCLKQFRQEVLSIVEKDVNQKINLQL